MEIIPRAKADMISDNYAGEKYIYVYHSRLGHAVA
jgi:hypothetical protein